MINLQNKKKKKDKEKKDQNSKPVRIGKEEAKILEKIKDKRDLKSTRHALKFLFDKTEEDIIEELESAKSVFCEKVVNLSDKYLEDGSFDKKLVADFLFILNNHAYNKEYISNMLEEMREELENGE